MCFLIRNIHSFLVTNLQLVWLYCREQVPKCEIVKIQNEIWDRSVAGTLWDSGITQWVAYYGIAG